jgi:hypothetical protein
MRIGITIVAGAMGLAIALHAGTAETSDAAWSIALLCLVGLVSIFGMPGLAVTAFGLAGAVSLGIAANGDGAVFALWCLVASVLAALSAVEWRDKHRTRRREIVHRVIDEELVPMDAGHPSRGADPSV